MIALSTGQEWVNSESGKFQMREIISCDEKTVECIVYDEHLRGDTRSYLTATFRNWAEAAILFEAAL